jgi:hypothetical protein
VSRHRHSVEERVEELVEQGVDVSEAMAIAHEESQMALEHQTESAQDNADEPEGDVDPDAVSLWDTIITSRIQHLKGKEG